jgi:hypothetical protein
MTENTRADALQMSRDLTSMSDTLDPQPGTDTAVRSYVQAVLRQYRADQDARIERITALEATGSRIIDGGQIDQDAWEIKDWRTGELLAEGTGDHRDYDAATTRLDPDGKWLHIDTIDIDPMDVEHIGIPESLANALLDWLGSAATPDEDVAQLVGWSADDVAHHREEA